MKTRYLKYFERIDIDRVMRETASLLRLELPQTFDAYHASAAEAEKLLRQSGVPEVERITFPADGRTAWQDKIAPLGWTATVGRITVLSAPGIEPGTVAADLERHPFHLIKGSTATAPGGEFLRLLTYEQMLAGFDPTDALVMQPLDQDCRCRALSYVLDLGARGMVSDFSFNPDDAPDELMWHNAFTERDNWHVNAADRDFLAFAVTPAMGKRLRRAAEIGEVKLHVESDGRRFESTFDLVTGRIPGRRSEELWIYAHLYEPLANDNSSGVAAAMETARLIMADGTPEFSLRLLFGLEHYGFAAYAAYRGNRDLSGEVLGAIDYDAMSVRRDWVIDLRCAGPGTPFYGNYLLRQIGRDLSGLSGMPELNCLDSFSCMYDDDAFLTDPTVGVPTVWPIRRGQGLYHNSGQRMDFIQEDALKTACALDTAFVSAVLSPDAAMAEEAAGIAREALKKELARSVGSAREHLTCRYETLRRDMYDFSRSIPEEAVVNAWRPVEEAFREMTAGLADDIPHSPWRDYAAKIVPSRLTVGFPFDLAKVPEGERVLLPDSVLYGPLANILADMDGRTDLAATIRRVEHERCSMLSEKEIVKLIRSVFYLARYGYVSLNGFTGISQAEIVDALRRAGVKRGDFLLVHSALAEFGLFAGGPAAVTEALREAVGPEGTVLTPVFSSPFVFLGDPNRSSLFRPMDAEDMKGVYTGSLPKYMARHCEARSRHITHSWCGFGRYAAEACADHRPQDPPVGERSPLIFALKHGGKVLHFGSKLDSTTFLHCLEDRFDLPGVEDTLCKFRDRGIDRTVCMPRNLPGHRDFYQGDETSIKFFRRALAKGLEIVHVALGLGEIMLMDLAELDRIGTELVTEDPFVFLCDDEKCLSCRRMRRNRR